MSTPQEPLRKPAISRSDTFPEAHAAEGTLTSDARLTQNHVNQPLSHDDLLRMVEELQRAHTRIEAALEESRKAAREVCANIFILQNDLNNEKAYHSSLVNTMTSIVGIELLQGLGSEPGQVEKKPRRTSASYHVMTVVPTGYGSVGSPKGSKRHPDDEDVELDSECSHNHKRPRLGEPSSATDDTTPLPVIAAQTIMNYPSEDDETDDTYSDSNGTERDFIDDSYSFIDSHGHYPSVVHDLWFTESSSEEETDPKDNIPWSRLPDFGEDLSDSDYQPPDVDPEDILELEPWDSRYDAEDLFAFNIHDEVDESGGLLSDSGLSTDDSEDGHHLIGILSRPRFPDYNHWYPYCLRYLQEAPEPRWRIEDEKWRNWRRVKHMSVEKGFPPVDLEQRLAELLESDYPGFTFDDGEWECFEAFPVSIRETGRATSPEAEDWSLSGPDTWLCTGMSLLRR